MKLYIAGPMTGLPDYNLPAFAAVEAELVECGYEVLNPGRHGADDVANGQVRGRGYYMRLGLSDVLRADGVAVLPGWERSRGAICEVQVARELDLPVQTVPSWVACAGLAHRGPLDG